MPLALDHHTVKAKVAARAAGLDPATVIERPTKAEPFADKVAEWVGASNRLIRADVAHQKLVAMNYPGSERTTRRVGAADKEGWRRGEHRIYRPWVPEPGLWLLRRF